MATLKLELAINQDTYKPAYKSEALNKEFLKMASAVRAGNKAMWKFATSVHKVLSDDLWKIQGDFESQAQFAKAIGKSEAQITTYKNAVEFIKKHEDLVKRDKNGDIITGIPFSKADILSKIENLDEFDKWTQENYKGCHIWEFGDNSIKKMLQAFNKPALENKTDENSNEDSNETTDSKDEKIKEPEKLTNIAIIDAKGFKVEFDKVPMSIANKALDLLKDYRVATYNPKGEKIEA